LETSSTVNLNGIGWDIAPHKVIGYVDVEPADCMLHGYGG